MYGFGCSHFFCSPSGDGITTSPKHLSSLGYPLPTTQAGKDRTPAKTFALQDHGISPGALRCRPAR